MTHRVTLLPYLIKFEPLSKPVDVETKPTIYGFDLDHTIIQPKTANAKFGRSPEDWKYMIFNGKETIDTLIKIVKEDPNSIIVIFTNQGGVITVPQTAKSCQNFKNKISSILQDIKTKQDGTLLLEKLWLYAAPKKPASLFSKSSNKSKLKGRVTKSIGAPVLDQTSLASLFETMRKPEVGMARQFETDLGRLGYEGFIWKYYCGDAAGRDDDFSDSDKVFAKSLDLEFKYPDDVFN